jgi:hypothetical protein
MLDRESQGFDMQKVLLPQKAIDINTQRMSRQLAVQAGTQTPKGMGEILFDGKLPGQLPIDGFDQLANSIVKMLKGWRKLLFLVRSRNSAQDDPVFVPQILGFGSADVGFVTQHLQVEMLLEQLKSSFQVAAIGGRQFKIQDQTAHGDQQMQPISKDGLFFGNCLAKCGFIRSPIARRTGDEMKLNHWNRQTINQALSIPAQIQTAQDDQADQVGGLHQVPPPPIEPALGRDMRKEMLVLFPATQHIRFHVPATAFTNQAHRNQLAIRAFRFRPGPRTKRSYLLPYVVYNYKNPDAKILKIRYHQIVLRLARWCCGDSFLPYRRIFRQSV